MFGWLIDFKIATSFNKFMVKFLSRIPLFITFKTTSDSLKDFKRKDVEKEPLPRIFTNFRLWLLSCIRIVNCKFIIRNSFLQFLE